MKEKWDAEQGDSVAAKLPSEHSISSFMQGFVSYPVWKKEAEEVSELKTPSAKHV